MILRTIRTAQMILRMGNIEQKTEAIRKKYIEFNQPCLVSYFVFDLDYSESALAWREENLPEPFGSHRTRKMGMCISVIAYCSLTQRQKSQASSQCSTLQKFRLQWLENLKLMQGTAENSLKTHITQLGGRCFSLINRIYSMNLLIILWLKHLEKRAGARLRT